MHGAERQGPHGDNPVGEARTRRQHHVGPTTSHSAVGVWLWLVRDVWLGTVAPQISKLRYCSNSTMVRLFCKGSIKHAKGRENYFLTFELPDRLEGVKIQFNSMSIGIPSIVSTNPRGDIWICRRLSTPISEIVPSHPTTPCYANTIGICQRLISCDEIRCSDYSKRGGMHVWMAHATVRTARIAFLRIAPLLSLLIGPDPRSSMYARSISPRPAVCRCPSKKLRHKHGIVISLHR